MDRNIVKLFKRSRDRSAVLLVGPDGLGKSLVAEAAAAAAGADVLKIDAVEASEGFCVKAVTASRTSGRPVVVLVEGLEASATATSRSIRQCLRSTESDTERVFIVATMGRDFRNLPVASTLPFGYVAQVSLPDDAERKQYLLRLFAQLSRVDPQWGSALRESAVSTLVNLTVNYTFSEIDHVVRRAFIRSTDSEGKRDGVALHHFEQILSETRAYGADAFAERVTRPIGNVAIVPKGAVAELLGDVAVAEVGDKVNTTENSKKKKDAKDPMDGIFGWCNFWLPEPLHLPPVVWAMIIFGIFAHFMARSTCQPSHNRKRRGAGGTRNSLFNDIGNSASPYPGFGDQLNELYSGSSPFAGFTPPMGMPNMPGVPNIPRPPDVPAAAPPEVDAAPKSGEAGARSGGASAAPAAGGIHKELTRKAHRRKRNVCKVT
jgi:hypothetical protein